MKIESLDLVVINELYISEVVLTILCFVSLVTRSQSIARFPEDVLKQTATSSDDTAL